MLFLSAGYSCAAELSEVVKSETVYVKDFDMAQAKFKGDGKDKAEKKDRKAEKKTRQLTFALGKHDTDKNKLYVKLEGWERINAVDDAVLKLVHPGSSYQ